jgi:hypothetical protein
MEEGIEMVLAGKILGRLAREPEIPAPAGR